MLSQFKNELEKKDVVIIDFRTTKELNDTWIIPWSKQMDFYSSDFRRQLSSLDKNKKYLIYCRSGNRSSQTLSIMRELWFINVFELEWWMNAWLRAWEMTNKYIEDSLNKEVRTITLNAGRWEYDKKELRIKRWEKVIIKVTNTDTTHGIAIPEMKLVWDNQIEVDTSKVWEFEFRCANYCWAGHQEMTWKIIIE